MRTGRYIRIRCMVEKIHLGFLAFPIGFTNMVGK